MAPPTTRATRLKSADMTVDQKLDLLLSDVGEIKNDNKQFSVDIAEIKEEIKVFKSDVNKSINFCSEQINDCVTQLNESKASLSECKNEVDRLSLENEFLKKQLAAVKKSEIASEQYSRSNCLEIRGVPESSNENIIDVVKSVAQVLSFQLEDRMIDAVHRLSQNPNDRSAPRGIIIKFCRRIDMDNMRSKSRVKNGFSAADLGYNSDRKVYINMSLTRETRALWMEVRAFKEKKGYKYAWITSAGKVFLRREEGARAVNITEKADLERLK